MASSSPQETYSAESLERVMQDSFFKDERIQRRLENEHRRDVKNSEKKIAMEKKILTIQVNEINAEQRLAKLRYLNLVKHSRKSKLSSSERKHET